MAACKAVAPRGKCSFVAGCQSMFGLGRMVFGAGLRFGVKDPCGCCGCISLQASHRPRNTLPFRRYRCCISAAHLTSSHVK